MNPRTKVGPILVAAVVVAHITSPIGAETAHIAVASNFAAVAAELEQRFEAESEHQILLITGSTGKLYAQLLNGAPFDLFLSADQLRPHLLEDAGMTLTGRRLTYAIGQLVLCSLSNEWSETHSLADILTNESIRHIVIPNPELAPFGAAAVEILTRLGIEDQVSEKLVFAENVGQAFAFVSSGNADIGFVSRSQVVDRQEVVYWQIPSDLHTSIKQDAVMLLRAEDNLAAQSFFAFLQDNLARSVITDFGYDTLP